MSKKRLWTWCVLFAVTLALQACASSADTAVPSQTQSPAGQAETALRWPKDKLETDGRGAPLLRVYVTEQEAVERMDVETYVQGVLAGEMKNTWPLEALKAQAILARTFVLKFVEEKESKYQGADVSTDIEEAQAYDAAAVNQRIRQAVEETRGLVLNAGGTLPYAWFHAHSGGMTELAKAGLNWEREEPPYTQATESREPETVSDAADAADATALRQAQAWEASFPLTEFAAACRKQGVTISDQSSLTLAITERGESGRAVTIEANGTPVNAAELRLALGSTKMRSTLLTSLKVEEGQVRMAGKGYGHGVGMSQWGAYQMAEEGKSAEEIAAHYFRGVSVTRLWE